MANTPGILRFPANLDDADSLIRASNNASTALSAAITSSETTLTVTSTSSFPSTGAFSVDGEVIFYTGTTPTTFTGCVRGQDGTVADAHNGGANVEMLIVSAHHNLLASGLVAVETKLGSGSSVPVTGEVLMATGPGTSNWGILDDSNLIAENPTDGGTPAPLRTVLSSMWDSYQSTSGIWGAVTTVFVNGATTLAGDAAGKLYVCGNAAANYAVTLPLASTCAGKVLQFQMSSTLTKLCTLSGQSGELIDGSSQRVLWAGESAILWSDGSAWFKIAGKSIPLFAQAERGNSMSVATFSNVFVPMDTLCRESVSGMVNLGTGAITMLRPGIYQISVGICLELNGSSIPNYECYALANINSTTSAATNPPMLASSATALNGIGTLAHAAGCWPRQVATGDYIAALTYQSTGTTLYTRTIDVVRPNLSITELPNW